jgi:hypothetical protein
MIRRLEAGEDPEKLEEEFGDAFENMDFPDGMGSGGEEGGGPQGTSIKASRKKIERDPSLHEFSDFV